MVPVDDRVMDAIENCYSTVLFSVFFGNKHENLASLVGCRIGDTSLECLQQALHLIEGII